MINVSDQEKELFPWKKDTNSLNQYGWRINIVFTGVLDMVQDDQLKENVVDFNLDVNDIEECHRVGKSDSETKSS